MQEVTVLFAGDEASGAAPIAGGGRYRPYPAYKDSGVEWLGEIPAHWDVKRLKHVATWNDEVLPEWTDSALEMTYVDIGGVDPEQGIVKREEFTFETAPTRARRKVRNGDVVVSTVRTYLRAISAIVFPEPNMIVSTGFAVIRPRDIDSGFAAYAVCASYFVDTVVANSVGVSYPAINADELVLLPVVCPTDVEQRAIADFLDREMAKIDVLVAKKERLVELLQEKRAALVTQVVTKGLNPGVPMKDSGVEWLGEIPAHWDVKRLKRVATWNDEVLPEWTDSALEMTYVDIGGVDPEQGIVKREEFTFETAPTRARRKVRNGDVIVSTVRTYLRAISAIVFPEPNMIVSTGFAVIRPRNIDSGFAAYAVCASYFVDTVVANSVGVSYPAINADELVLLPVVCPTDVEQRAIADFLDRETAKIDVLVTKVREAIDRLKELRTALISAAVTGKIDVREAAA